MRLAKTVVEAREKFVAEMAVQNPDATGEAIQEALAAAYAGKRMRMARLYEVIRRARDGSPAVTKAEPVDDAAALDLALRASQNTSPIQES